MKSITSDSFFIYRSSAGSGKTYQLALEFVSIVIKNPNLFNKILAVTFTNKATKEMKERVLSFLVSLASKKDNDLMVQVMKKTDLPEVEVSGNANMVIGKILHQYSQFSINTIDAFFQKIVKSFAKELGLLGNYKVELDQEKVKQEIIDQIIDDVREDKDLTNWLIDFSFSKLDDNSSWNIRPEIESLAAEMFKESFKPVEEVLLKLDKDDYSRFLHQLRKIKSSFEQYMKSNAQKALTLIHSHRLTIDDFSRKSNGPAGYFERILHRHDYDPKKLVPEVCNDPDKWSTKTSSKKGDIQKVVNAGLQETTTSLVHYYQNHILEYSSVIEVLKNFYVFGILSYIIKKLKAYRFEHDVMLISDVPIFLNGIIAENEAPFIYEKTGTWYQHFLIDEFQDTSGFQWHNFKPLVESGLSSGNLSLLVGDGKQSIYRWRGGDWNLILHKVKKELQLYQPEEKHLNVNWRSSRKIVEFNNELFGVLPSLVCNIFKAGIPESHHSEPVKERLVDIAEDVEKLYADVLQQVAIKFKEPSRGRIEVCAYQKDEVKGWKDAVLDELPMEMERLQEAGYRPRDLAILVRKGEEGRRVIERLIQYKYSAEASGKYCYDAISNESLYMGKSTAIRIIINTIRYCLNPDDSIALSEISFNYAFLEYDQSNEPITEDLEDIFKVTALPREFFDEKDLLIRKPIYEMVERIIQIFHLGREKQKAYLQAFQDVVLEYFSNESKDLHDFLVWWDEKGKRKSVQVPDSINAIRVMTIHKSKGLEFKAVLIPFCDWNLDHDARKGNYLWCKSDKKPFSDMGYLPLKYSSKLERSYFMEDYYEEMVKAHIDNLNLLYVALTRAENVLMLNCPPPSKDIKKSGDLVLKGLEQLLGNQQSTLDIQIMNDKAPKINYILGKFENVEVSSTPDTQVNDRLGYITSDWRERIAVKKRGGMFFDKEGLQRKEKINYGLLVHEILASIIHENEAGEVLDKYFTEGEISSEDKEHLLDHLNRIFANQQVKQWFNTDWDVRSEVPIVIKDDQPKRPDRVLIRGKQAIIIDFKTGVEKSADKKQVLDYAAILMDMGYQQVEAYLLYLGLNKVINVA